LWTLLRSWGYLVDDTFIGLRYARNLVEGNGLVFNPGERVEGYTSSAWVLLSALFLRLRFDPIAGLTALTAASAACVLVLTARLERRLAPPDAEPIFVPTSALLLLASAAFAYWSIVAMESMLFTALFLAALAIALRESDTGQWRGSGLLFLLLAFTRPEGVLLFVLSQCALLAARRSRRGRWGPAFPLVVNVALFAAGAQAFLVWRALYYGELLPNTFYAKVTGGREQLETGIRYLGDAVLASPVLLVALLCPFAFVAPSVRVRLGDPARLLALYAVLVGYVLYVVAVGADFMPYLRFFLPVLPLAALLVAALLQALPSAGRARAAALPALLALQCVAALASDEPYRAFVAHRTAVVGERVGAWLAAHVAPGDLIAVNTAGSLPYTAKLPTIDMLGLADPQIARRPVYVVTPGWAGHRRGWGEYVLERRPRVVLWYNSAGLGEPHYLSDRELADDPLFRFFYRIETVTLPPAAGGQDERKASPIRRFLGHPFGEDPSGHSAIPDLGLQLAFHEGFPSWTTFFEGPLHVVYFELDARDTDLWEDGLRLHRDVPGFVEKVVARDRERRAQTPAGDPAEVAAVATLCDEALRAIEGHDLERARALLSEASSRNRSAQSPLAPQYVANLAVQTGELFTAVGAEKEALRLDPENPLYRENLARLLSVPYESFRRSARPVSAR